MEVRPVSVVRNRYAVLRTTSATTAVMLQQVLLNVAYCKTFPAACLARMSAQCSADARNAARNIA